MGTNRQDSWNTDEDLLLAEVVLRHIREGSTQLSAFEEVGRKLSRTSAACGFRWNSHVRKQYKSAIEIAKQQRKSAVSEINQIDDEQETEEQSSNIVQENNEKENFRKTTDVSFDDILEKLHQLKEAQDDNIRLTKENDDLRNQINETQHEKTQLKEDLKSYKQKYDLIEEDYQALIEIMERARKMVVLRESSSEDQLHFQMDKNGNLERVKKS